ncbi:hypothetical protein [Zooshikella harenae]|uniref:Uncharacterized protein n=1 Tax=Zooshikella harenae TaxID=2827238 RepID=A0ABS5ZJI2_9GAMM|nr:hypothetical protein [Zooshikella harenae]MBU2714095.1 hypothetical protein [Zooshikella harenae]
MVLNNQLNLYKVNWNRFFELLHLNSHLWKEFSSDQGFTPEGIYFALEKKGLDVEWKAKAENWELTSQKKIVLDYLLSSRVAKDEIWLINDSCYEESGMPYYVDISKIDKFFSDYEAEKKGISFIDYEDLIVICPEQCLIGLYHHSGYYLSANYGKE